MSLGTASQLLQPSLGDKKLVSTQNGASLSELDRRPGEAIVPFVGNDEDIVTLHQDRIVTAAPIALLTPNPRLSTFTAIDCLTAAVYYEAGNEPAQGQRAVAQVVLNRVRHPEFPSSVCGVVFEGAQRSTGCQFTFTCDGSLSRLPRGSSWERAQAVAIAALSGYAETSIGHATHYHATYVQPYWASSLLKLEIIGSHAFYLWPGSAGQPKAFTDRYDDDEKLPPNARLRLSRYLLSAPANMPQMASLSSTQSGPSQVNGLEEARALRQASPSLSSSEPETSSGLIEKKVQLIPSQATLKPSLSGSIGGVEKPTSNN